MEKSLVKSAEAAFFRCDYSGAVKIYSELSRKYGEKFFRANLIIAQKRMAQSKALARDEGLLAIRRPITINLTSESDVLELTNNTIWCDFYINEDEFVVISTQIYYEGIQPKDHKKALAIIEYLDSGGDVIASPYHGLNKSDQYGCYAYIAPPDRGSPSFSLVPPARTSRVRIGFRSFYVSKPQRVVLKSNVLLNWLDNKPMKSDQDHEALARPLLPVLPFENQCKSNYKQPTVAAVLDKFSYDCFKPECNLVSITPSKWRSELIDHHIDFILVESAWHGNNDSWLYRVANYANPPGNELSDLLRWARKIGIPTVFWNKEDPPNFDRFIDRAVEFDYIFTTDENCIDRYRRRVGADRMVAALPFAAQPRIHNPSINQPRLNSTSFAGTYYADDFEPRRRAMDMLLREASRYGLDIFDRMHNVTGKDKSRYEFPLDLQPYIRGTLEYSEMVEAYRHYRVALNVNSVSDSPTMFSRRVFELLACGTPVVSTQSMGIDRIFRGVVSTVESHAEASKCLERLMTDAGEWLKTSVKGIRAVFTEHTYAHRLATIASAIGLDQSICVRRDVVVLVRTNGDPSKLAAMLGRQRELPSALLIVGCEGSDELVKSFVVALKGIAKTLAAIPLPNVASYLRNRYPGACVAMMDGTHYYGPSYLLDARIALDGTGVDSATGIVSVLASRGALNCLSFDDISSIGMIAESKVEVGSLVISVANSRLEEFVSGFFVGHVNPNMPIRTRAPVDFLNDAAGYSDVKTIDVI